MAFSQSDLTKLSAKVLAANVVSSENSKQWYEASLANNTIVDALNVWTQVDELKMLYSTNIADSCLIASENSDLILAHGYDDDGTTNDDTAIRLTPITGTSGHDWILTETFGDMSTVVRNIISPTHIPKLNGLPSSGYSTRLFRGVPSLGDEILTTHGYDGNEVGWFFNVANSLAMFADADKPEAVDEIYAVCFQYVGNTCADLAEGTQAVNPDVEFALASISGDETFHFEDLNLFIDENGIAILFESTLEDDEDDYEGNLFLFEGDELFTTLGGIGIDFSTTQGISDILEPFIIENEQDIIDELVVQGYDEVDDDRLLSVLQTPAAVELSLVRRDGVDADSEYYTYSTVAWFLVQDGRTTPFKITNNCATTWVDDAAYLQFENCIVILDSVVRSWYLRRTGDNTWEGSSTETATTFIVDNSATDNVRVLVVSTANTTVGDVQNQVTLVGAQVAALTEEVAALTEEVDAVDGGMLYQGMSPTRGFEGIIGMGAGLEASIYSWMPSSSYDHDHIDSGIEKRQLTGTMSPAIVNNIVQQILQDKGLISSTSMITINRQH